MKNMAAAKPRYMLINTNKVFRKSGDGYESGEICLDKRAGKI